MTDLLERTLLDVMASAKMSDPEELEMARDLNRHVKSIDNALQRVKRKIEKNLSEVELY